MHSRHRSPGSGVRSNLVEHARISPEGLARGHGLYDSDYRSFNKSYGRGSIQKPYPPQPPPCRGDIFMEAGRLAAEYLVSQGLLPPNVLPNKWKNGNYADIKLHDRDNPPPLLEGRTSALARLGNVTDAGSRRRSHDEFGWRNQTKGRRRSESVRSYGSDWGRNGSWSEKSKGFSSSMDGEEDYAGGRRGEGVRGHDSGNSTQQTIIEEHSSKNGVAENLDSELDTYNFPADGDLKEKCSSAAEEPAAEVEKDVKEGLDDAESFSLEVGEVKDSSLEEERVQQENSDKHAGSNDLDTQECSVELGKENILVDDDHENSACNDLKSLCAFGKVPTRARSSLASKVTKPDNPPSREEEKVPDMVSAGEIELTKEEAPVESSLTDTLTDQTLGLSGLSCGIAGIASLQSMEEPGDLDTVYVLERERCARSQSFSDRSSFVQDKQEHQGPPGFARSRSAIVSYEEERLVQSIVSVEGGKKRPREWDSHTDDFFKPHNSRVKPSVNEVPGDEVMVDAFEHESTVKDLMFPGNRAEHIVEEREEKQLLPGLFKICDLNLSEASDISENSRNVVLSHEPAGPSSLRPEIEAPVDVGLSISSNFNGNEVCAGPSISNNKKEIIVVDVDDDDDDLVIQDRAFSNSEKKSDIIYSSLENFLSHTENNVDLPDVPGGYGLVSELLENDIPNCSPVPADLHNDLDNEIALHNQEVIPDDDDDDPIYLSLGEIPLSFMGMWDQPNQEYGKSF